MKHAKIEHPIYGHVGKKVKFIRLLQGIKQKDIAEELGVSQQSISSMENAGILDSQTLEAYAKAMGVTPGFILNTGDLSTNFFKTPVTPIKSPEPKEEPALNKVVELYERLLEAEKEKIAYLENLLEKYTLKEFTKPYRPLQTA